MSDLMRHYHRLSTRIFALMFCLFAAAGTTIAADIDIYGPTGSGSTSNAIFLLDNTSNWSSNNQGWEAGSSWARCNDGVTGFTAAELACQTLITSIYYPSGTGKKPWESGYAAKKDNVALTQGQVQLRALKLVLNELVCANTTNPISVNVGLAMIGDSGSVISNGHSTGFIFSAVEKLAGLGSTSGTSCNKLISKLDTIDAVITSPTYKAPANANYGAAMYEIFKYFGGYADPIKASTGEAGSPTGSTGYGPIRFSKVNPLDDVSAFTSSARSTYKSPISASNSCSGNFMILVGNTYPNAEPSSNGGPVVFNGLSYTPPTLPASTSDTSRTADEWSYFLANADVSSELGTQSIKTYAINTYNTKPDASQTKLLKSMAAQGGVGPAGYLEVGGDLVALVDAFKTVLTNIAAVDSVFTATTLPVSTTTQGTYLNQVFVGMFKPDANYSPRWLGNLKQYELGFTNGVLDLKDASTPAKSAIAQGFFAPEARSYWTEPSVFFDLKKSGTPETASDAPDGKIVEKGGAAQQLRTANLLNATSRKIYTILPSATPAQGASLSATPFTYANVGANFNNSESWVKWIRGENNVSSGNGMEDLNGSYSASGTITPLPDTGARASIHGDVLHSRPIALNYGTDPSNGGVVVYYGANDGFFRAIDGRKTGTTAGSELWSFIAPEFYSPSNNVFERLYKGTPFLKLPENSSNGNAIADSGTNKSKPYGMDGPIGAYARYNSDGSSLLEGIIFPTMRRGGDAVYAINVTSKSDPKFLWKIQKNSTYTKLGQTWSLPKPLVLKSSDTTPPFLLVMGGGYDPKEDALVGTATAISSSDRIGNAIYIINGRTGALIKELPTEYSVPSDVSLVDVDRNGEIDRGYVADVRGNLYRIDFPSSGDLTLSATWETVTPMKIANLGGKVFFPPDVLVTRDFVAVMIGTGDREKPLQNTTADNFFLIKDTIGAVRKISGAVVTLQKTDLTRVAKMSTDANTPTPTSVVTPVNDDEGCYLELATNGEKVVNAPLTVSGITYFGTNRPTPSSATQCSADLGQAYAYQFPLFCATPPTPTKIEGGGLAPNPVAGVVLINVDGKEQKVNFLIGSGKGGSNFTPVRPDPTVAAKRTRLYWKIDNANR